MIKTNHILKNRLNDGKGLLVSYHDTDEIVGKMMIEERHCLWEQHLFLMMAGFISRSKTFLDIGSHIGSSALLAKCFNKDISILCFEPQLEMYKLLNKNIQQNNFENIKTYNCSVGDSIRKDITISNVIHDGANSGELYDYNGVKEYNFGGVSLGEGEEQTEMITVDSLNLESCDFMKIDVEGYEFFVLTGAMNTIKKFMPTIFFEHSEHPSEIVKPSDYMMSICSKDSKEIFDHLGGNIFNLLMSFGYNYFRRLESNYFVSYWPYANNGEVIVNHTWDFHECQYINQLYPYDTMFYMMSNDFKTIQSERL